MQVVASRPASELIRDQGGRLYVWLNRGRCCGHVTTLATATAPPRGKQFRLIDTGRINILERWIDRAALDAFRGAGVSDEQGAMIREARVTEFTAGDETSLR